MENKLTLSFFVMMWFSSRETKYIKAKSGRTSRLAAVGASPPTPRITAAAMPGGLLLGVEAPNFEANTTLSRICFHNYLGDSWGILFSHPPDFTPVCVQRCSAEQQILHQNLTREMLR